MRGVRGVGDAAGARDEFAGQGGGGGADGADGVPQVGERQAEEDVQGEAGRRPRGRLCGDECACGGAAAQGVFARLPGRHY